MTKMANAYQCLELSAAPRQSWFEKCQESIDREHRSREGEASEGSSWGVPFVGTKCLLPRPVPDVEESLSAALRHISDAIEGSRSLLQLQDDWDEAGAVPISKQTWRRATEFLSRYAGRVWDTSGDVLDAPDITPVPDGSIDLHWDSPTYEMLINIPVDPREAAGFYGDDRDRISIEGHFDTQSVNEGLLHWLTKAT